jgi:hypothetical protein
MLEMGFHQIPIPLTAANKRLKNMNTNLNTFAKQAMR